MKESDWCLYDGHTAQCIVWPLYYESLLHSIHEIMDLTKVFISLLRSHLNPRKPRTADSLALHIQTDLDVDLRRPTIMVVLFAWLPCCHDASGRIYSIEVMLHSLHRVGRSNGKTKKDLV
ncbi:unnamed protein product [Phytophthora fragariaefolia]|uniref:Unnamed protein product n=1 Tax=Phytophthora fragariaefolia TaxID=1490495 RepID=A0A9W6YEA0_9STRA|nr:unnamed protein product [Phytophthora fragariaefolia]